MMGRLVGVRGEVFRRECEEAQAVPLPLMSSARAFHMHV